MLTNPTIDMLRELGLSGMASAYHELEAQPEASGLIATKDSGVGFPIGGNCATFGDAHRDYI